MTWMQDLSSHYNLMRKRYPNKQLMIVFDIDDTIVDIRIPMLYVLKKYDSEFNTTYFSKLKLEDITFEEWRIQHWLPSIISNEQKIEEIVKFVRFHMWEAQTIFLSHKPFQGVLEIIRWFQIQENTTVGLNTGRAEELRDLTLQSLNTLGKEYRVNFPSDLLYMNPFKNSGTKDVKSFKAKGIEYYKDKGFKVIAFIDNEPANLKAVNDMVNDSDILLLHANTIFGSSSRLVPETTVVGEDYDISDIINQDRLPNHIEFVWNGVNDMTVFDRYEKANVFWAELDARLHPLTNSVVLRHASFDAPTFDAENLVELSTMLDKLLPLNRGIKIVLKAGDILLDKILDILSKKQVSSDLLWFDVIFEVLSESGLQKMKSQFPNSIISTRVDFLVPLLSQFPNYVYDILQDLQKKGISKFSVSYNTYNKQVFINKLEEWGFLSNIRDIYTLEDFLRSIIILPNSIISSFTYAKS